MSQSETRAFNANFGGVTSLTGPNALTATWTYDGFGRKTQETYWQATALSALGRVTSGTLGNGLSTTRNYDVLDRPLSITAGSGGGNVEQLTLWTCDSYGRRYSHNL